MKSCTHPSPTPAPFRRILVGMLLAVSFLATPLGAADKPEEKPNPTPGLVEVRFANDDTLKMEMREQQIEIVTPYGKLRVPFAEVRAIDFATRITPETAKKVEKLIAELANPDEKARDQAVAELLKLKDRAYPALVEAAKSPDADLKRRAEDLLERLRESVPEGQLLFRKLDMIQTDEMKIFGKIEVAAWKAKTAQFGDVEIKLVELRGLRTPGAVEETTEVLNPLPDPGNLGIYAQMIGKKFAFRVTGVVGNGLYGTEVYTSDSLLANAAVHWGVIKAGQTGIVKVEIVVPPPGYTSTTRNGITSNAYGAYNGAYKILK